LTSQRTGDRGSGPPANLAGLRGLVLGVATAGAAARHFSAAMGRRCVMVTDVAAAWRALESAPEHSSALVMLPRRSLTFHAANTLIEISGQSHLPVGVLPLDDAMSTAPGISRLIELSRRRPRYPHRAAVYCDFFDHPPAEATTARPMFGRATSAGFIEWLRAGIEAVVLHVHGNGADFRVGSEVLCVQVGATRPLPGLPGERYLPCQAGGRCRLEHKTSFHAYHGAAAIRSRLVVLLSCSAFHPADGLLDPRFTFIDALMRGDHVAGVVASTRINFGTPGLAVAAMASLDAGLSLGEITRKINSVTRYGPASYLCLGDPELRLSGPATIDPTATSPSRPTPTGRAPARARGREMPDGTSRAAARCLQSLLVRQAIASGDYRPRAGAALARALDEQAGRELASHPPPTAAERDLLDRRLCLFLAQILARRGPDMHDYLHTLVAAGPQAALAQRHDCGCRMVRAPLEPAWLAGGGRWLYACERCGTVANQPMWLPLSQWTGRDDGSVVVDLPFEHGRGWYACAVAPIAGHIEDVQDTAQMRAMAAPATWPRLSLTLPDRADRGLRRWGVAAVSDGDFLILQRPLSHERGGPT
jgi:hypothetical protein